MANTLFDALVIAGEDALTNHGIFGITIPSIPITSLPVENLCLRATEFSIPPQVIETYEIMKRGKKFTRPSGVSGQEKTFTVTYRVDKYYGVYNMISAWMAWVQSPSNLTMASDSGVLGTGGISKFRAPLITITGMDTNGTITNAWTYTGVFPSEQAGITFNEETGDPITCEITFQYIDIIYPGDLALSL